MKIKGSILESYADKYCFMIRNRQPDGAGGFITTYDEGEQFLAVLRHDSTIEAQQAEQAGTASTYTFYVYKGMDFEYREVIKRLRDGQYFRVTDPEGKHVPVSSPLGMKSIQCERWEMGT